MSEPSFEHLRWSKFFFRIVARQVPKDLHGKLTAELFALNRAFPEDLPHPDDEPVLLPPGEQCWRRKVSGARWWLTYFIGKTHLTIRYIETDAH